MILPFKPDQRISIGDGGESGRFAAIGHGRIRVTGGRTRGVANVGLFIDHATCINSGC